MRLWYDCEFVEDGKTIDLISIGMVTEDGREYYAQNAQCKFKRASPWVRENVLAHLVGFDLKRLRPLNGYYDSPRNREVWRTRAQIREDLWTFGAFVSDRNKLELWGYYSAYDHVALCQLFGTMMDLRAPWPMYTRDIKQWCDELGNPQLPEQGKGEHNALADARWNKTAWEFLQQSITARHSGLPKGLDALPTELLTREERRLLGREA